MTDTLLTFDDGVPTATVSALDDDIDAIQNGTQVYDVGIHGAACVRAGGAANTTDTSFRVALGMSGDHYGSIYMKNTTGHGSGSASVNFWQIVSSLNEFIAQMRVRPSNALSIRVNNIEVYLSSVNAIPINAVFRMDWRLSGTSLDWKVFYDPEADGSTPDLSGNVTARALTATGLILGAVSTSSVVKDWSFDTVRATNTGSWFGAFNPPPATGVMVWDGTDEIPGTLTLWDGTNEIPIETLEVN
jgi:hypothetical protein